MDVVIDSQSHMKANKREVPPGMPAGTWWRRVNQFAQTTYHSGQGFVLLDSTYRLEIPWTHELLEYLSPGEMARIKAKALVWYQATGSWPDDISCWWEIRQGRNKGYLPWGTIPVSSRIDDKGTLHCGKCDAKWSQSVDSTYPERCQLCGSRIKIEGKVMDDAGTFLADLGYTTEYVNWLVMNGLEPDEQEREDWEDENGN